MTHISIRWSGRWDLNPRQPAWKAGTLPLSYARLFRNFLDSRTHHAKHLKLLSGSLHITRSSPTHTSAVWWAGKDSNLGRHKPADLQSAPFGHLGTCPRYFIVLDQSNPAHRRRAHRPTAQQRQADLPVHSFLPQSSKIDSLKCSDRLG